MTELPMMPELAAANATCWHNWPSIEWIISLFWLVVRSAIAQRSLQASRSNYRGYLHVLKYLLFIVIIIKQKGVMQTYKLADECNILSKLSRLDVCKPTRLHRSFLL